MNSMIKNFWDDSGNLVERIIDFTALLQDNVVIFCDDSRVCLLYTRNLHAVRRPSIVLAAVAGSVERAAEPGASDGREREGSQNVHRLACRKNCL